jgi:hypothetical protein
MTEGKIVNQLQELIKKLIPASFTGKVLSVDEEKGEAVVLFNELEYDVKLKSIIDKSEYGVFVIPEAESDVFCIPEGLDQERYFVAGVNKVAKVIVKMQNLDFVMDNEAKSLKVTNGNTAFELNDALAQFNDGDNGGLVKITDLVTKINNLETKVNDLITKLKAVVVPLAPSGTYPFSTVFGSVVNLTQTKKSDLENEKVKH